MRILIGDDEVNVLKVTKTRLEHEGYEVVTAADGEQVLERALAEKIHLILLDVKMPKMNGLDVCRALKRRAETEAIPVIVYSGSEGLVQSLADRCIDIGAAGWLVKPFKTSELLGKIRGALNEEGGRS
jgi:DNA-binding response OmpR family regulator